MLDTSIPPQAVKLHWKTAGLREIFGEEVGDISTPESPQDHQNELALKAQIGDSRADLTAARQEEKRRKNSELQGRKNTLRTIITDPINNSISPNKYLNNVKLNDEHMVDINDDKILMVRSEGPDSELREMTIGEKNQIEDTSKMNSLYVTQDEIEMNTYLRGDTDVIPNALRDLAEGNGRLATDVSRDEFKGMVAEKYPVNISLRVNSDIPLRSGGLTLDDVNLLPPLPEATPAPDAPAPVLANTPMM